jgi:hypothetical protein
MKPPTFHQFAGRHCLRVRRDEFCDTIVRGKFGRWYEHNASRLGIVLEVPLDNARLDKTLRFRKRCALATGFLVHLEGDFEAILLFD